MSGICGWVGEADPQVLDAMLDAIDGAFAAAWWDGEKHRLTLLRDPFGVRNHLR